MAFSIQMTSQLAVANGVKMLVYGSAGMGKTMLTATLPSPVLLSAESGVLSLSRTNIERLFGPNVPGISYDIPTIPISTLEELDEAYQWIAYSQEARCFHSVALDSLSEMGEVVLNNAKRTCKDPRQAYGELIEKMETKIRQFRDLPGRNVYVSAKMEPQKDELTGMVKQLPSMPGTKLGPKIPYFFDEVFAFRTNRDPATNKEFRYLQTFPDLQYEGKDRSGALDQMEYPHLGHIINKIIGVK